VHIGFIGNTNNTPFMLALAMRRLGHQVTFVVDSTERLHRPEHKYPALFSTWPEWVLDVPGADARVWRAGTPGALPASVRRALASCDALVFNKFWALTAKTFGTPYVCILTGSDIELYAEHRTMQRAQRPFRRATSPAGWMANAVVATALTQRLRRAIRHAAGYVTAPPGYLPQTDAVLQRLQPRGVRICGPITDVESLHLTPLPTQQPWRILNAARLNWVRPVAPGRSDIDLKGTDVLLRGVAAHLKAFPGDLRLSLVEKGDDIAATHRLVTALGLDADVDWLPEMTQSELYAEYARHDVVADQIGLSMVSMVGLDAMAMGRPVIADGKPEVVSRWISEPSPIVQVRTPDEVTQQLRRLREPAVRTQLAAASRVHVARWYSTDGLSSRIVDVLSGRFQDPSRIASPKPVAP
jgi:glycosyltransferase involved in cell wall biosynthesis